MIVGGVRGVGGESKVLEVGESEVLGVGGVGDESEALEVGES